MMPALPSAQCLFDAGFCRSCGRAAPSPFPLDPPPCPRPYHVIARTQTEAAMLKASGLRVEHTYPDPLPELLPDPPPERYEVPIRAYPGRGIFGLTSPPIMYGAYATDPLELPERLPRKRKRGWSYASARALDERHEHVWTGDERLRAGAYARWRESAGWWRGRRGES